MAMIKFAGPSDAGEVISMRMASGQAQLEAIKRQGSLQVKSLSSEEQAAIQVRRMKSAEQRAAAQRQAPQGDELLAKLARRRAAAENGDEPGGMSNACERNGGSPVGSAGSTDGGDAKRQRTTPSKQDELAAKLAKRRTVSESGDVWSLDGDVTPRDVGTPAESPGNADENTPGVNEKRQQPATTPTHTPGDDEKRRQKVATPTQASSELQAALAKRRAVVEDVDLTPKAAHETEVNDARQESHAAGLEMDCENTHVQSDELGAAEGEDECDGRSTAEASEEVRQHINTEEVQMDGGHGERRDDCEGCTATEDLEAFDSTYSHIAGVVVGSVIADAVADTASAAFETADAGSACEATSPSKEMQDDDARQQDLHCEDPFDGVSIDVGALDDEPCAKAMPEITGVVGVEGAIRAVASPCRKRCGQSPGALIEVVDSNASEPNPQDKTEAPEACTSSVAEPRSVMAPVPVIGDGAGLRAVAFAGDAVRPTSSNRDAEKWTPRTLHEEIFELDYCIGDADRRHCCCSLQ